MLGSTDSVAASGNCGAAAHYAAGADGYTATYYGTAAAIGTFFTQLAAGTLNPVPRLIHIVDAHCANGLATDTGDIPMLTTHAADIANFVNSGGALLRTPRASVARVGESATAG